MQFLGRLAKFWLLLAFVGSAGYFGYFNRERITVTLPPWIDSIQVPAYTAYVLWFLMGAAVTSVYLGLDTVKKSLEIRRLTKQLRAIQPETQHLSHAPSTRSPTIDPSVP